MVSSISAKGSASVAINPGETEARIVFIPDTHGKAWDMAALNKLTADNHLAPFPDPKALETFLLNASRAKSNAPLEFIYARGTEPEYPISEQVSWEELPVPADMAVFKDETIGNAAAPEIFRIRIEKVKCEKMIKKPGALPFMAGKKELSVSWEKKEIREQVEVDPELIEIKYAEHGAKLGTIVPALPGKPGKSVFGRLILPKAAVDSSCLFGKGIGRETNEIVARFSGFVRIGKGWADMVPLSRHLFKVTAGNDGISFFLYFEPGDEVFSVPKGEEILSAAVRTGADESSLVSAEELDNAIRGSIQRREPLEVYPLLRSQDAEARVDINSDNTKATLFLRKGVAGAAGLEMKAISEAIKKSAVVGFDTLKLKEAIKEFMRGRELTLSYTLIEGVSATRGKDREVHVHVTPVDGEEAQEIFERFKEKYKRDVFNEAQYDTDRPINLAFVKKNAAVASVDEGAVSADGKDIFGKVIPGLPGNDPELKLYQGLLLHGSYITAAQEGLLLYQSTEKCFRGEMFNYEDARIVVRISEDAMEARGDFFLEEGPGTPLTIENINKVLAAFGVTEGIDLEEAERICALAKKSGSVTDHLIARGEPSIAPGSSMARWFVPLSLGGSSSYNPVSVQVKAGNPIVELSEPLAAGKPGFDVRGNEIPISEGLTLDIEHDDSVRDVPMGQGKRLVAARSGELSFDGKKLCINFVKIIQGDVEGDIRFSGEIQIKGNVLPLCKIMGGSHITVDGLVEEAFVSVEGKAIVIRGFKGGGRGVIRARAGIVTAFAEQASLVAMGDVQLDKGTIRSSIRTNGKLSIKADDGKLSGGVCQARYGIDAADIGSEKSLRTELSFGQDYMLKDEIFSCEEEMAKQEKALNETEEKIKDLIKRKEPITDELKKEKIKMTKLHEQFSAKIFNLREKFEEHCESEVRIRGTVFPGVVIESHNRYYVVKQKRSRVIFYFDRESGRILEKPID